MSKRIGLIGSGFGSLALAVRLQASGHQVTLFEKGTAVGGRAGQLKKNGYTFDLGPSLITAPDIIEAVFKKAGRKMEDYLRLIPLDPFYRIYFHDRTYLDYTGNSDKMKAEMSKFNPEDAKNYDRFMAYTERLYHAVITEGLGRQPFSTPAKMIRFLPKALGLRALSPAYRQVSTFFEDERNRFTFSFHPLFIGGNPFTAPSLYLMIPYLEKTGGVWFTKGGMYELVNAFASLFQELGGRIKTGEEVTRITVTENRITGIQTRKGVYSFDAAVSNADPSHTYGDLIAPSFRKKWTPARLGRIRHSMSAFLVYLGVRHQYKTLLHHTLILSKRYKPLIEDIFKRKILAEDFSMYLHIPSRTDPSMAPAGCDSMYILVPVPNLESDTDWEKESPLYAKRLIRFLEHDFGLHNLEANIDVMETLSPADFKHRQNATNGSAWGPEPTLLQSAYFRPHNRSEDIKGLYLVGASTHPGAGVPGVLLGAEATEAVIGEDIENGII